MKRANAERLYYALEFVLSMPSFVFIAVFLVRDLHLTPLQLILVGSVMEATIFVTEIPTGVVADTYSRRASLVVSFVVQGIALITIGVAGTFAVALVAWGLWGFGYTFMSGAYEAWITDEVGADNVGRVFMRGTRICYAGELAGLGLSVALATIALRLPVILGGVLTLAAGVACVFAMPETGFTRRPRGERGPALAELRATASAGGRFVRAQPILILFLGVTFFAGMSSEAVDRLWEAHFIRDIGLPSIASLDPVVWFGLFGAAVLLAGLFASTVLISRFDDTSTVGLARTLLVMTAVLMAAELAFALASAIALALAGLLVMRLVRTLVYPVKMTWLNRQITDSSVRATVLSINGQTDAIGQAGGGPVLGAIGNVWGIRAALVAGALVLAPALGLYGRAIGHHGREAELQRLPETA